MVGTYVNIHRIITNKDFFYNLYFNFIYFQSSESNLRDISEESRSEEDEEDNDVEESQSNVLNAQYVSIQE